MTEDKIITIDQLIQKILEGEKQYDLSKIVAAYEVANQYGYGYYMRRIAA